MIPFVNRLLARLRAVFTKSALDADFDAELAHHLEQQIAENIKAGLSPEEARRQANISLGGVEQVRELHREARGLPWLEQFGRDCAYAGRLLWREKKIAATILLTFALCLGTNVVIYTVVHSVVLNPLPFPRSERLVVTYNTYTKAGISHTTSSVPNFFERRDIEAFAAIAAFRVGTSVTGAADSPERIPSMQITKDFFEVLEAQPALGRFFSEDECTYGNNAVAVLSDDYWRQHFNGDAAAIGRTITIDGNVTTIVGVLPPRFRYLSTKASLWQPLLFSKEDHDPQMRHHNTVSIIARLRPDATIRQAQEQINALNERLIVGDIFAQWAKTAGFRTIVAGLQEDYIASVRPALLLLQAGALLLLFIGVVNIVNLLIIRASVRAKELAVRQALGASRQNIVMQFISETMFLGIGGCLIGLGIGALGLGAITRLGVDRLPLGAEITLTIPVVLTALVVSIFLSLLLAIPLVAFSIRADLAPALGSESRGGTTNRSTNRLRYSLIVAQIALAFVLLVCAGLLGLSFKRILSVHLGFRPDNIITAWVGLPGKQYQDKEKRFAFANRWLAGLQTLPGVTAVGIGTSLPIAGEFGNRVMWIEGQPSVPGSVARTHHLTATTGDYFTALGIPLLNGRFLNADDSLATRNVCIIDDVFARHYWPDRTALGQHIFIIPPEAGDPALTVVGVVGSVKQLGLNETEAMGMVYYPLSKEVAPDRLVAVVRTQQDPVGLGLSMRSALHQIDPTLPIDGVKTMNGLIEESLLFPRSMMLLAAIFAGIALSLAAIGVYGILAYAVTQRQREIAIRLALGALPAQIRRQFLCLGGTLLLIGCLLGSIGAWFAARAMTSLLFEVSPLHVVIFVGTAALLGIVVLLASVLPARRATSVSAIESLRTD